MKRALELFHFGVQSAHFGRDLRVGRKFPYSLSHVLEAMKNEERFEWMCEWHTCSNILSRSVRRASRRAPTRERMRSNVSLMRPASACDSERVSGRPPPAEPMGE